MSEYHYLGHYSEDPPPGLFPYKGSRDGNSYGLEFHFLVREKPDRFIVYNKVDGCIWGTWLNADQEPWAPAGKRIMSLKYSHEACLKWNGLYDSAVPTAEIDATP